MHHWPSMTERALRQEFRAFPFRTDASGLKAWQKGQTGYPYIDAGLRELWATGWMHNRVRMAVASFLVKHQLIPWQEGERWFWDTLVDADAANNAASWQWVAGSGADAAPYFRIFNPITQGRKFDPDGVYVRKWVPELARLPDAFIHAPFEATAIELAAAGVTLGRTYPHRSSSTNLRATGRWRRFSRSRPASPDAWWRLGSGGETATQAGMTDLIQPTPS